MYTYKTIQWSGITEVNDPRLTKDDIERIYPYDFKHNHYPHSKPKDKASEQKSD